MALRTAISTARGAIVRRCAVGTAVGAVLLVTGGVVPAHAAFKAPTCMMLKLKAWGNLRQCQRAEDANAIQGNPADLARCHTKFHDTLAMIADRATAEGTACRFHDNGDNTVTDLDTGLMWLKLVGLDGVPQANLLDADNKWDWGTALQMAAGINGQSTDAKTLLPVPGVPPYGDWRVPTIVELKTIRGPDDAPDCQIGGACINPIFGPTAAGLYWSTTTGSGLTWVMSFLEGLGMVMNSPGAPEHIRAVRSAL